VVDIKGTSTIKDKGVFDMSAGDFLKVAVAQLRQASVVLKQEAHGMLSEKVNTTRQKSKDITQAQARLKAKQFELSDPSKDDQERRAIAKQVSTLQQEITNEQQAIDQLTRKLTDIANTDKRTGSRVTRV
jgi:predicted RNase H-like nuclease (RuvC/YqgF family)